MSRGSILNHGTNQSLYGSPSSCMWDARRRTQASAKPRLRCLKVGPASAPTDHSGALARLSAACLRPARPWIRSWLRQVDRYVSRWLPSLDVRAPDSRSQARQGFCRSPYRASSHERVGCIPTDLERAPTSWGGGGVPPTEFPRIQRMPPASTSSTFAKSRCAGCDCAARCP